MFLGNKPEVHCKTLLWVMHQEELNKYCLSAPLGGFVSYISFIPLPGTSYFIISEVYSEESHDWFACEGLNSKLTKGRMRGKECGGGEGGRGWGLQMCSLSRWALLLQEEHCWPGQPMVVWRKQERIGRLKGEVEMEGRDICRDRRLRRVEEKN